MDTDFDLELGEFSVCMIGIFYLLFRCSLIVFCVHFSVFDLLFFFGI